jgi:hypothetical protein
MHIDISLLYHAANVKKTMDTNKSYLYLETISQYVNPAENLDIARIILHLADIPGIEHFVQNN